MQGNLTSVSDFPRTSREFVQKFPSDNTCAAYLEQLRWPAGFLLSGLSKEWNTLASDAGSIGLCNVSPPDISDCWYDHG